MVAASDDDFHIHIELTKDALPTGPPPAVSQQLKDTFLQDGFVVIPHVLCQDTVSALNDRLEEILRGNYDRNQSPDKRPRLIKSERIRVTSNEHDDNDQSSNKNGTTTKRQSQRVGPLGFSGNLNNVRVMQVINVHKSDHLFRSLATCTVLGKVVAELAGWPHGARLAQDQVWAKPPGATPLVFHRDSPYFMFIPSDVVTVWVALDDMDEELGPLEYVKGSHFWGDGRWGSSNQFFDEDCGYSLLRSAADRAGVDDFEVVSMAGLKAGGISIHDGRTWHGSKKNDSKSRPRRGLGIHFVPAQVRFTKDAEKSRLWSSYVENVDDLSQLQLPEEDFPLVWQPQEPFESDLDRTINDIDKLKLGG